MYIEWQEAGKNMSLMTSDSPNRNLRLEVFGLFFNERSSEMSAAIPGDLAHSLSFDVSPASGAIIQHNRQHKP